MKTDHQSRNRWLLAVLVVTLAALRDRKIGAAKWIVERALSVEA